MVVQSDDAANNFMTAFGAKKRELLRLLLSAAMFLPLFAGTYYAAYLLRFAGELRATGEVLVDMLPLLQRTGFDAAQLRADQRLDSAQRALRFFADHYQGDVHQTRPLFARGAA